MTNHQPPGANHQPPFMKRAGAITCFYLMVLLSAILPLQQIAAPTDDASSPHAMTSSAGAKAMPWPETRALWVVRTTMVSPGSVREMVRRAKENGFTDLIVQVRGRG